MIWDDADLADLADLAGFAVGNGLTGWLVDRAS
ncbi:hypothetical protein EC915_111130 [Pseudomonas sp. LP_7_YM]|nr:hypothetical protein EC915_111130 [Pseudomonas sp. LP_7_YM]